MPSGLGGKDPKTLHNTLNTTQNSLHTLEHIPKRSGVPKTPAQVYSDVTLPLVTELGDGALIPDTEYMLQCEGWTLGDTPVQGFTEEVGPVRTQKDLDSSIAALTATISCACPAGNQVSRTSRKTACGRHLCSFWSHVLNI